jgi:hypothetical protein
MNPYYFDPMRRHDLRPPWFATPMIRSAGASARARSNGHGWLERLRRPFAAVPEAACCMHAAS